ncbi:MULTISPECIES: hypothetical protein [unclassified Rhizobium]|uniref:hypothetical protein n=1 Tax=unclassified Rhizobium TaxID=2613769 RepID=UPI000F73D467|nr:MULTISPECIES: hypothetical protein [unclassified Rhizobium]
MKYILGLMSILLFTGMQAPNLPEGFSIQSLGSIEGECPAFGKSSPDAALIFECDGSRRSLRIAKTLKLDGSSYMKDPDPHAKEILLDIGKIINEELHIENRLLKFCDPSVDSLGRCKTVYTLSGSTNFEEAALAINPKDNKIDSFSYFLIIAWERGK